MGEWIGIGELAATGTALLWTLSVLAWTSASRHVGALSISFLRLVVACPFWLAYGRLVRGLWLPSDAAPKTWLLLGLSGFLGFFLGDLCFFKALLLIGPRLTLLLQALAPPFAALISWLFLGDSLSVRGWLAMGITLAGVSWVVLERPEQPPQPSQHHGLAWGITLAALAAAGQAVGMVLAQRGIGQYDAVAATFIRALGAMIGFVFLLTVVRRWPSVWIAARHRRAMLITTLGALVGPFAGVALCMVALRHCHVGIATTITSTTPVLILPFVVLLYNEQVSLRAAGGAILSVAGVALLLIR